MSTVDISDIEQQTTDYIHQLTERIKELTCLYKIVDIANKPDLSLGQMMQDIVNVIPHAMQFPDIACTQLNVNGENYFSEGFQSSNLSLSAEIVVNNQSRGLLEVFYHPLPNYSVPVIFLNEEERLIKTISQQISLVLERKIVEETNAKLQEQLRHADRLATIGQLAAGIAHEINEPLGTILGFAELVGSSDGIEDTTRNDIKKIINATLHAREVVRKLMLFSRQMPPKKSMINLNQIIEDGLYFLENRCQKQGISINKELSADLPNIIADAGQMHQVLVNLAVNAMQAMSSGGTLTFKTIKKEDQLEMHIQDTGVGMDKELIKKIFIPFFTTKDIHEGTGLGLSVVHGIINSHNGRIEVESKPGKGTIFKIILRIDYNGK